MARPFLFQNPENSAGTQVDGIELGRTEVLADARIPGGGAVEKCEPMGGRGSVR